MSSLKLSDVVSITLSGLDISKVIEFGHIGWDFAKPEPKKSETIVEYKCPVCGEWCEANRYHSSCYTEHTGPAMIAHDGIEDAEIIS